MPCASPRGVTRRPPPTSPPSIGNGPKPRQVQRRNPRRRQNPRENRTKANNIRHPQNLTIMIQKSTTKRSGQPSKPPTTAARRSRAARTPTTSPTWPACLRRSSASRPVCPTATSWRSATRTTSSASNRCRRSPRDSRHEPVRSEGDPRPDRADATGLPFNSIMALLLEKEHPSTPLVNAGAISPAR